MRIVQARTQILRRDGSLASVLNQTTLRLSRPVPVAWSNATSSSLEDARRSSPFPAATRSS
jgi:hypothetical protein